MKEEDTPLEGKIDFGPEIFVLPPSHIPLQVKERGEMEEACDVVQGRRIPKGDVIPPNNITTQWKQNSKKH